MNRWERHIALSDIPESEGGTSLNMPSRKGRIREEEEMGYDGKKKVTFKELLNILKKGIRKGNWRKLSRREKALYRAAMAYAKAKKKIVNGIVVEKLSALIEKLMETQGMRVFKRGSKKADELLQKGEENGVFAWVPRLKAWLRDPDYIFWLGAMRWW